MTTTTATTATQAPDWPSHIAPGDTWTTTEGDWTVEVAVEWDHEYSPQEHTDDPEMIAAWERGEFGFVGVIAHAMRECEHCGETKECGQSSLWGIDYDGTDDSYLHQVAQEQAREAVFYAENPGR